MAIFAGKIYDYDWVTQRSTTSYPLRHNVEGLNNSFILDAHILIPIIQDQATQEQSIKSSVFYLSRIISDLDGYRLEVSTQDGIIGRTGPIRKDLKLLDDVQDIYALDDLRQRTYSVLITNPQYQNVQINFYIGDTYSYSGGTLDIAEDAGVLSSFCRSTYSPIYSGIKSINNLIGDVVIQADQGIIIDVNNQSNTIKIYRQLYDFQSKFLQKFSQYIKTINGVSPDSNGNIQIKGSDCLQITQTADNALTIQNPCGKPCCSLQEYSTQVTKAVDLLMYQKETLRQMLQSMGNNINFMQANLATILGK